VFHGLRGEFKDLVTSLVTRTDLLPYADLLSHLLTHEFIHKSSHLSMGSAAIHAPLLRTPNIPPSALLLTVSLLLSLDAIGAILMAVFKKLCVKFVKLMNTQPMIVQLCLLLRNVFMNKPML
jgi:hypothetical protein